MWREQQYQDNHSYTDSLLDEAPRRPKRSGNCFAKLQSSRVVFPTWLLLLLGVVTLLLIIVLGVFVGILSGRLNTNNASAYQYPASYPMLIHFSDMHLDPFYNATVSDQTKCRFVADQSTPAPWVADWGRNNCDSPQILVESQVEKMASLAADNSQFKFVVFTGDMAAHGLGTGFSNEIGRARVLSSITLSSKILATKFSTLQVLPCLGNNDVPVDYVMPDASDPWLSDLAALWEPMITCAGCSDPFFNVDLGTFNATFLAGGYYSLQSSSSSLSPLRLIVLNTLFFYVSANMTPDFVARADAHMAWIGAELQAAEASKQAVYLMGHIPPIVDPYHPEGTGWNAMWSTEYQTTYLSLINSYKAIIKGHLFGHLHTDDFKALHAPNTDPSSINTLSMMISPSISPVYNNNAAFRTVIADETWTPVDYQQYFVDIIQANQYGTPAWLYDYAFRAAYGCEIGSQGGCILQVAANLILQYNESTWWHYWNERQVHLFGDQGSRYAFFCLMRFAVLQDVINCAQQYPIQYN